MPILTLIRGTEKIEIPYEGTPVLGDLLRDNGYGAFAPCGGKGLCGRCEVELAGEVSAPDETEKRHGKRLSCRAVLLGDATARLIYDEESFAQIESTTLNACGRLNGYGVAVDIGTTTVVLKLFDEQGRCVGEGSSLNPQRAYGADVISRMDHALHGRGEELQDVIIDCIYGLLNTACENAGVAIERIERMVVTGNTAMLYFLMGLSPESISRAPFTVDHRFGEWTELFGIPTYLPPVMNAFVGADITCAVLASGICESEQTSLLCDMGTNGELALWREGKLYVTSCAAGPAFEGADISCGCGAVLGAIDKVWLEGERVSYSTIGGVSPVGLCGSGLIDAVAAFLERGDIDESGYAEDDMLISSVALTPGDVRSLQLAKAAVSAGIITLINRSQTEMSEIDSLILLGGFGGKVSMRSAALIGLIPRELAPRAHSLGNGALNGAVSLLFDQSLIPYAERIADGAIHVELGGSADFNDAFIENMTF